MPSLTNIRRKLSAVVLAIAIVGLVSGSPSHRVSQSDAMEQRPFRVVGYLPNYRVAGFELATISGITDLILFSAEARDDGSVNLDRFRDVPWPKFLEFKTQHRIRLILCVGGWERSRAFSRIATHEKMRSTFSKQLVEVCREYRLDGVDLDWEHPEDQTEVNAYGELLSEISRAFQPLGLQLSVTIAGWQHLSPKAIQAVDWVQVMAYDHPGRHSTFESAVEDVRKVTALGVEKSKLVLGIPFYGRRVNDWNSVQTFAQLSRDSSFTPDSDELNGYYFNGRDTVIKKVTWARSEGLGGIMIWELGQDAIGDRSLLQAILDTVDSYR